MTEDELLAGIVGALELSGRLWTHHRRSDRAEVMGAVGLPDILGVIDTTLIAWELKAEHGHPTRDQLRWIQRLQAVDRVDARIIRPNDYDATLDQIVRGRGRLL